MGRAACEPGVGENVEIFLAGKDGGAGRFEPNRSGTAGFGAGDGDADIIRIVAGEGFDEGDPGTEGIGGGRRDGFAIVFIDDAVAIIYPYPAADAIDTVAVGITAVKAELIADYVVNDQTGAKAQGQPKDIDAGIALVTGEEAHGGAKLVVGHGIGWVCNDQRCRTGKIPQQTFC